MLTYSPITTIWVVLFLALILVTISGLVIAYLHVGHGGFFSDVKKVIVISALSCLSTLALMVAVSRSSSYISHTFLIDRAEIGQVTISPKGDTTTFVYAHRDQKLELSTEQYEIIVLRQSTVGKYDEAAQPTLPYLEWTQTKEISAATISGVKYYSDVKVTNHYTLYVDETFLEVNDPLEQSLLGID